ncbi:HAMP domain-containing sensor histidine kinase [Metabacillus fastidiosus]|uniref:sensor histidine kinase n=1 Tax=Metabacillus fastidiosus TaxID=1458 RepID=UPI002E1DAE31|nr:HAMP domain-containing sensor histidine kinase [Metabacillus fastidiosus]
MSSFQLSIKKWAFLFLILFLIIPILITRVTIYLYEDLYSPYRDMNFNNLDPWVKEQVLDDVKRWKDLSWQRSINEKTDLLGINIRLTDSKGQQLFSNIDHSKKYELNSSIQKDNVQLSNFLEEYTVFSKGELLGIAYVQDNRIFETTLPKNRWFSYLVNEWGGAFVWLFIFTLILFISIRFIKKRILYPLKEFKKATDSIGKQNFDFEVPYTPIKEINELSEAIVTMQGALKSSLDKQNEMEKERKIFISSIIHDLRTPLFSIRGCLEGIKKGVADTPDKINKYIDISYKKANILNELINDLYMFTKVNYIEITPKLKKTDLIQLVDHVVKGFYPEALKKGININAEYQLNKQLFIDGDDYLLSRAIENIIGNAIRYTPSRGEVSIRVKEINQEYCTVSIKDNGVGISPNEISHIFSPLYRGEKSRNRKSGGSGLGLSIAKQVIEKHNGSIKVYSNHDSGTTFEILLPFPH